MTMKYINAIVRRTITAVGGVLCCTLFTMSTFAELCADGVGVMSIAGRWRFALGDSTNCTDVIDLPSTTDIACILTGNRLGGARRWRRLPSWSCRAVRCLDAIACVSWWITAFGGVLSPEHIKTQMKAEVIRLETFGDINFDVLVEETAKIDVTELRRASRSTSTGLPPSTSTAPLQPRK